ERLCSTGPDNKGKKKGDKEEEYRNKKKKNEDKKFQRKVTTRNYKCDLCCQEN
ncbi:hypothetical protein CHS0354_027325, partial [Potamilus streckersoni]